MLKEKAKKYFFTEFTGLCFFLILFTVILPFIVKVMFYYRGFWRLLQLLIPKMGDKLQFASGCLFVAMLDQCLKEWYYFFKAEKTKGRKIV